MKNTVWKDYIGKRLLVRRVVPLGGGAQPPLAVIVVEVSPEGRPCLLHRDNVTYEWTDLGRYAVVEVLGDASAVPRPFYQFAQADFSKTEMTVAQRLASIAARGGSVASGGVAGAFSTEATNETNHAYGRTQGGEPVTTFTPLTDAEVSEAVNAIREAAEVRLGSGANSTMLENVIERIVRESVVTRTAPPDEAGA